ncbi:MAG TPA: prepilin-type N-terminal cleavage/methylation domain-containing protein [Gemmatimonadales bacterium]|nr:prepilin-type N-terminal cleavage/methylation domain-containing protein [Gemmatimonadales bacterium]
MSLTGVMRDERGFTLAELLTAMAVLGLLLAGLFLTLQQGQSAYLYGAGRAEVQQNARVALERMLRELRDGSSVATAGANDVKFTFLDDTSTLVTVEYSLSGASAPYLLQRNQTVPALAGQPDTLVGGVSNFTVTYYDFNNVATTTAANAYAVNISITTQSQDTTLASYSPANRRATVAGRVRLRNE